MITTRTARVLAWWHNQPRWRQVGLGVGLALALGLVALSLLPASRPAGALPGIAPEPVSDAGLAARVLLNLGLVIGLIYGSLYLLRRWQSGALGARSLRHVAVLETTRLSPRQAVHVIRVGERTLLIGATDQSVTLLTELDSGPAPDHDPPPFSEALRRASEPQRQIRA